jgi:large subunit ribosomal protein L15
MKLHELRESCGTKHRRKRVGRGTAAGQGKTSGFGTRGNGSRSGRGGRKYFEGGQLPLVHRLPRKRGFKPINRVMYAEVNIEALKMFSAGTVVDATLLAETGLVGDKGLPVKVLGYGELDRALTVKAQKFTATAKAKIEAAGGMIEAL